MGRLQSSCESESVSKIFLWNLPGVFMDPGGDPPPLPLELFAFQILVASCGKRKGSSLVQQFVKKVDIPTIEFPVETPCQTALNLSK